MILYKNVFAGNSTTRVNYQKDKGKSCIHWICSLDVWVDDRCMTQWPKIDVRLQVEYKRIIYSWIPLALLSKNQCHVLKQEIFSCSYEYTLFGYWQIHTEWNEIIRIPSFSSGGGPNLCEMKQTIAEHLVLEKVQNTQNREMFRLLPKALLKFHDADDEMVLNKLMTVSSKRASSFTTQVKDLQNVFQNNGLLWKLKGQENS